MTLPLGGSPSSYLASLEAVRLAAEMLQAYRWKGPIALHTTSKVVLQVLDRPVFTSSTALAAACAVDEVSRDCQEPILLAWGNPKANHRGADIATMLAKEAVEATSEPSLVELPVPKAILKQHFQTALETRWNDRWTKAKMAEQSRTFWPCIDLAKS